MGGDWVRRGCPVPDDPLPLMSGNPVPYLVIQLAMWPGKEEAPTLRAPAPSSETPTAHSDVSVSSAADAAASASQPEVGEQA